MHDEDPAALSFTLNAVNENTIELQFFQNGENHASPSLCHTLALCQEQFISAFPDAIVDYVPSYTSLLIYYDFTQTSTASLCQSLTSLVHTVLATAHSRQHSIKKIEIPVYYGEETGPDLPRLAEEKNLSIHQVVELHSSAPYVVYAMGFAPGFTYMGFVCETLQRGRLQKPRRHVPKGSVGIADRQTGIYPCDSPGGWNIIGRTPMDVFDVTARLDQRSPFRVGDNVSFIPISKNEYLAMGGDL